MIDLFQDVATNLFCKNDSCMGGDTSGSWEQNSENPLQVLWSTGHNQSSKITDFSGSK